jgi:acetyltransferase-like isoleucine patch superfamily enzyme
MLLKKILEYAKMRLWAVSQFPDVGVIHAHGGIGAVTAYLKQCASPTITRAALARFGAAIHPDCQPVGPWITVHEAPRGYANLRVGAHCHIGKEVFLDLTEAITLEDGAGLGMRAIVLTHLNFDANPQRPLAALVPMHAKPTTIKRGAMVGAGAILLAGVTVGEHSVVGAGCVVSEDVPPYTVLKSPAASNAYRVPDTILRKLRVRATSEVA